VNFADRLDAAIHAKGNPVLLGIDPHLDLLPPEFDVARDPTRPRAERARWVERFCVELIDLAADVVPAVKPQSAFFEQLGSDGVHAFERVVDHARHKGLVVVGDVKRGDIASTAAAYARAFLAPEDLHEQGRCDAITLSPYLGEDALEPFVRVAELVGAGAFVLVRTSNPGGSAWQDAGSPSLAERVAEAVAGFAQRTLGECGLGSIGAVVGATHPRELAAWRERMPASFLLLPGYGAQGAGAQDVLGAFLPGARGALVSSSRAIAFAYREDGGRARDWREAARTALDRMVADLGRALARPAT
jgi:orotidine-5'-phosphate decarboxylase